MSDIKTSDEELRDLIYDALTYVQDKDYFARKGTIIPSYAQVEAIIELIKSHTNSEITAVLDRLKETEHPGWRAMNFNNIDSYDDAFEQGVDKQRNKFITAIEAERKRL